MKRTRRTFTSAFKSKVVLEAIKERESLQELSERFDLRPQLISRWKKEIQEGAVKLFQEGYSEKRKALEIEKEKLQKRIEQLNKENDWLRKKLS